MKKILFLTTLFYSFLVSGQSLELVSYDSIVTGDARSASDMESHIAIKNVSHTSNNYLVKRIDHNYNSLTDSNAICWGVCFIPSVSVSPVSILVNSGATSHDFIGHVYPDKDGYNHEGPIDYVFYREDDPNDSLMVTVIYATTGGASVGVKEVSAGTNITAYPNPATNGLVNLAYRYAAGNATVEIHNLLGQVVYNQKLNEVNGNISIDVSSFKSGIYFYSLKLDGKKVSTKKLIIK